MIRYFCAVTPPEPLLGRIEAFRTRFGNPHHRVEPHVTVKVPFLHTADPAPWLEAARAACAGLRPFVLQFGAPDRFPEARVLYLTVSGEGLQQLHEAVLNALRPWAPPDPNGHEGPGFSPHLTLAAGRFGIDSAGLDRMEEAAREELAGLPPVEVRSLRCYRKRSGDSYWQPFADLPLGPEGLLPNL